MSMLFLSDNSRVLNHLEEELDLIEARQRDRAQTYR